MARLAMLALAWLVAVSARADAIFLRGGEKLIGKIVAEEREKVVFESQTLGKFEIARDRIERIERETPAPPPAPVSTNQAAAPMASDRALTNSFYPW